MLELLQESAPESQRLLIVGAGAGEEAIALSRSFPLLEAIEPNIDGVALQARPLVRQGSATQLDFPDGSFDIVYCYHVLEHIDRPLLALQEMQRVLKDGGQLLVGVPNKHRILSYVCVGETPWRDKILWNLIDWKARILGRFENRFGAHAGYTRKELSGDLGRIFPDVRDVTKAYYQLKWPGSLLVQLIGSRELIQEIVWPSIYFVARKGY